MKILVCHNFYQQPGGEDQVFRDDIESLRELGHEVILYTRHNDDVGKIFFVSLLFRILWNWTTFREVRGLIRRHRPDVVHVHNYFLLISPSVFFAAGAEKVPVIWNLDNQRLMCPSANFTRSGRLCTACLGRRFAWPGVWHGCYRGSRLLTLGVALVSCVHFFIGTWHRRVSGYLASTEFYRNLFVRHGLPAERIYVKPHMVFSDPGLASGEGKYALFIGRLDPEKGAMLLVEAWRQLQEKGCGCPLKIRGDGQLRSAMQDYIARYDLRQVSFEGRMTREELFDLVKGARFLIWPSLGYYETFGLVAFEAFACGRPVIASDIGVLAEHVKDKETGLTFKPGDAGDLADKVQWAFSHPAQMHQMGLGARHVYERSYNRQAVTSRLVNLYRHLTQGHS